MIWVGAGYTVVFCDETVEKRRLKAGMRQLVLVSVGYLLAFGSETLDEDDVAMIVGGWRDGIH